jgi:exonuclease VII large subunit
MPPPPESPCCKSRVEALSRLVMQMFADRDRQVDSALRAHEAANDRAVASLEKRLDLLNEFRNQSIDEAHRFALREVVDQRFDQAQRAVDRATEVNSTRFEAAREATTRELHRAEEAFTRQLDAMGESHRRDVESIGQQMRGTSRLVYMGLGMAVLFPLVLSTLLVLTR